MAAIAVINWLTDPYRLRETESSPVSAVADLAEPGAAFLKAALTIAARKPRTLILGTSRAARALDPIHRGLAPEDGPVLNVAMGAASIQQTRMMLVHAHETARVKKAIIGLDLEAFLGGARPDFDATALLGHRDSKPVWLVLTSAMCSRDLFFASLQKAIGIRDAGANLAPQDRFEEQLKSLGGQRGLVWIAEFNTFYGRLPDLFPLDRSVASWNSDERRVKSMREFRALLEYARRQGIELHMFISPIHARFQEWYRRVGWWPLFENWKRALVQSIEAEAHDGGHRQAFEIWDFSGFHALATEPVPRIGDLRSRMHWYGESSHYARTTGDLILDRMLDGTAAESSLLPNVRINASNIEAHIRSVRADADRYRASQPGEVANVAEMVRYLRRTAGR